MKNVEILRKELSKIFDSLIEDKIDIQQAKAIVATSNAMLKSAQLEMEHSKMTGDTKTIKFLKTE